MFLKSPFPVEASVTYDFNSDTVGQTPANTTTTAGTFQVANQATLGNSLHTVTGSPEAAIHFDNMASTTDYSVTWEEAYASGGGRSGFTLRAQAEDSTFDSQAGIKQGYNFQVNNSGAASHPNNIRIYKFTATGATAILDVVLTSATPRWYRATVSGTSLSFYYSTDGITFNQIGTTVTDSTYTTGGVQYVSGFGSTQGNDYVDNIVQTTPSSTDATISAGTLASQTISGTFTGGANTAASSALTVTVPDASKTNAALALTQGNANSTINYIKGSQPANDAAYTGTYSAGSTQITVANGDIIWLLVTAQDGITKLYYKITVTVSPSTEATLNASTSTIKGATVTSLGTPNSVIGSVTGGTVTLTVVQAADTSNAGSYITSFVKTNAGATVNKVFKYASGNATYATSFATDTPSYTTAAVTNGDFFIVQVTAADGTTILYYKVVVTVMNNSISITSPVAYRVFQRNVSNQANITITGTYSGTPTSIEASWNGGAYTTIVASPTGGTFSGTLVNQAAGQGTLTVRFTNDTSIQATKSYIGVGDIFVIAGQSNASGRGNSNQSYSGSLKASLFGNDDTWKELVDPTDSTAGQIDSVSSGDSAGGSIWPLVATLYLADQNVPVAFIPTAKGGTAISAWQPNAGNHGLASTLYGSMYRRINAIGGSVKAVLFWQGESDVEQSISQSAYKTGIDNMVNSIYSDFGVKTIVAQIGDYSTYAGGIIDGIRLAQKAAWNDAGNALPGPVLYDVNIADTVHFKTNTELQIAANRFWAAIKQDFYAGTSGRGPILNTAQYTPDKTNIYLTFTSNDLPIFPVSGYSGFTVKDNGTPVTISSITKTATNQLKIVLAFPAVGSITVSLGAGHTGKGATVPTDSSIYNLPAEIFIDQSTTQLSNDATVLSSAYTVSALSGGAGTITGVSPGISKTDFLAALTLATGATWDTTSVANPVVSGNTLVVTAQDGTTTGTYTITVKTIPTLSISNSPVTYNASQQTATVSGSVAGSVSNVQYNSSDTVPTNAGTYAIAADFAPTDSANYTSLTGASAGNFVINKASQSTLTFTGQTVTSPTTFSALSTVGGSGTGAVTYAVTTAGTAGCSITGTTLSYTSAGTCGVTATKAADSNYNSASSTEATFTINAVASTQVQAVVPATTKSGGSGLALLRLLNKPQTQNVDTMTSQQKIIAIAQIKQQLVALITQVIQLLTAQLAQMGK